MQCFQRTIQLRGHGIGCHLVTHEILAGISKELAKFSAGVVHFFSLDPCASLTLNENADPSVRDDMLVAMRHLVPEKQSRHGVGSGGGGGDDGAVRQQLRALLMGTSGVCVPISNGRLELGTWQGVYLCNWSGLNTSHSIVLTVNGNTEAHRAQLQRASTTSTAPARGCHAVSADLLRAFPDLRTSGEGLLTLLLRHTSASLTVAPLLDTRRGAELEQALNAIVPERWNSEFLTHTAEGPDDMPGHLKCSMLGASHNIPCAAGSLLVAPGHEIFLCEHRDVGGWGGGHNRKVSLVFLPSSSQSTLQVQLTSSRLRRLSLDEITAAAPGLSRMRVGVCTLFMRQAAASVVVASAAVSNFDTDLAALFESIIPGKSVSDQAVPAIRSTVLGCGVTLPITDGRLALSDEQAVWVWPHTELPSLTMTMTITIIGLQ